MKRALIFGVTGQDGSYLAELLLARGYEVHGVKRRSSSFNTQRIDHIHQDPHDQDVRFFLHFGDATDASNTLRLIQKVAPDEIYNLAAQSHVGVSFETPEYTANVDALGTLRMLEAIRILGLGNQTRFYQASTSEIYGNGSPMGTLLSEKSPFCPRSPYGAAKLYAYWITVNYREAYGMYACNGILFNHEGERRGETFVSRKITRAVSQASLARGGKLYLGNLDARRDWGHAIDYVAGMQLMLQAPTPDDYVLATGVAHSVRDFAEAAFAEGGLPITWRGKGADEVGLDAHTGETRICIDPKLYRPAEVDELIGDPRKARDQLGWEARVTFPELVKQMVAHDLKLATREKIA